MKDIIDSLFIAVPNFASGNVHTTFKDKNITSKIDEQIDYF